MAHRDVMGLDGSKKQLQSELRRRRPGRRQQTRVPFSSVLVLFYWVEGKKDTNTDHLFLPFYFAHHCPANALHAPS